MQRSWPTSQGDLELRGKDSNLRLPVQSRASLPLDYPAMDRRALALAGPIAAQSSGESWCSREGMDPLRQFEERGKRPT
jgi:hypothetical protein